MILYIYDQFIPVLGVGDELSYEYCDPNGVDHIINALMKIVEHHAMLREHTKNQFNEFQLEMKRLGKTYPDANDLPPQHRSSWGRRSLG